MGNASLPFLIGLQPTHPSVPGRSYRLNTVLHVLLAGSLPKIRQPVIVSYPIYMIYLLVWPATVHIAPRKAVCVVRFLVDAD